MKLNWSIWSSGFAFFWVCLLAAFSNTAMGQEGERTIQGIVFDQNTKQRVAKVYIYNTRNDQGVFNNTRGEFTISAKPEDILVAAVEGYFPDTMRVQQQDLVLFNLRRRTIMIQEVQILALQNPEEQFKRTVEEFSSAYSKVGRNDIFSVSQTGAGLNIDAIYSLLSKEGRNARRLQGIIERDYKHSVIDYRFTSELVSRTTGLSGANLKDFMNQYRPTYDFIKASNEYNLIQYIRSSYLQYIRNPGARRLPGLPKINGASDLFKLKDTVDTRIINNPI